MANKKKTKKPSNRLLKNDFLSAKPCENPNDFECFFSKTGVFQRPAKPVSVQLASSTNPDIDSGRIIDHTLPLSFEQLLARPFMRHFYSLKNSGLQGNSRARFFQFNEKDMQSFLPANKNGELRAESRPSLKKLKHAARKKIIENFNSDKTFSDIFRMCQSGDEEVMADFGNQAVRYCEHLYLLAQAGNGLAARYLAEIAILATKGLEKVMPQHLDSLKALAAYEYAWPLMTSPVTSLTSPSPDWQELSLGTVFGLKFDPKKRVNLNTPVGRFTWQLLNYVVNVKCNCTALKGPGVFHLKTANNSTIEYQALKLPDFSNDTTVVRKWWKVAERCLIESFPLPEDCSLLNENHPQLKDLVTAKSHKKTPGKHRAHILEKIYEQFWSLAGAPR